MSAAAAFLVAGQTHHLRIRKPWPPLASIGPVERWQFVNLLGASRRKV